MYVFMFKGYMKTYFQDHASKAELSLMLNGMHKSLLNSKIKGLIFMTSSTLIKFK